VLCDVHPVSSLHAVGRGFEWRWDKTLTETCKRTHQTCNPSDEWTVAQVIMQGLQKHTLDGKDRIKLFLPFNAFTRHCSCTMSINKV
jgi:hypothetical protein